MDNPNTFMVEIVYAKPDEQVQLQLKARAGDTIETLIKASGILNTHPEIDLSRHQVGIFGKRQALDTVLQPEDRIEIYRELTIDPKQARLLRAKKK